MSAWTHPHAGRAGGRPLALVRLGAAIPDESGLHTLSVEGADFARTVYGLRYRHQTPRPEADVLLRVLAD